MKIKSKKGTEKRARKKKRQADRESRLENLIAVGACKTDCERASENEKFCRRNWSWSTRSVPHYKKRVARIRGAERKRETEKLNYVL